MSRLPRMTASEIVTLIRKAGFVLVRQSGSHHIYRCFGIRVTVPFHPKKILHPKIIKEILNAVQRVKDFQE